MERALNVWIPLAVVALPIVVAAIERGLLLRFLARTYRRGGPADLKAAAAATKHLLPPKRVPAKRPRSGARRIGR